MTEHTEKLHQQLWNIANTLREKMGAERILEKMLKYMEVQVESIVAIVKFHS